MGVNAFIFSAIYGVGCSLFSIFFSQTQVSNIFGGSLPHPSLRTSHLTYSAKLVLCSPMVKLIQNDSTALTPSLSRLLIKTNLGHFHLASPISMNTSWKPHPSISKRRRGSAYLLQKLELRSKFMPISATAIGPLIWPFLFYAEAAPIVRDFLVLYSAI